MKIWKKIKSLFDLNHVCRVCGKEFDTKRGLNIHMTRSSHRA